MCYFILGVRKQCLNDRTLVEMKIIFHSCIIHRFIRFCENVSTFQMNNLMKGRLILDKSCILIRTVLLIHMIICLFVIRQTSVFSCFCLFHFFCQKKKGIFVRRRNFQELRTRLASLLFKIIFSLGLQDAKFRTTYPVHVLASLFLHCWTPARIIINPPFYSASILQRIKYLDISNIWSRVLYLTT